MSAPEATGVVEHVVGRGTSSKPKRWVTIAAGVELARLQHRQQHRRRARVHQTGRDRDVLDPQLLEVQRRRLAVHADVGDAAAGTDQRDGQSKVAGMPTASIATSAPRPSGQLPTTAGDVVVRREDHESAPKALAASRRLSTGSTTIDP